MRPDYLMFGSWVEVRPIDVHAPSYIGKLKHSAVLCVFQSVVQFVREGESVWSASPSGTVPASIRVGLGVPSEYDAHGCSIMVRKIATLLHSIGRDEPAEGWSALHLERPSVGKLSGWLHGALVGRPGWLGVLDPAGARKYPDYWPLTPGQALRLLDAG